MGIQQALERMRKMRLPRMVQAYLRDANTDGISQLSFEERLALIVDQGAKCSDLRPDWCRQYHLAYELGNAACREGLSVRYYRIPTLARELAIAQGGGTSRF